MHERKGIFTKTTLYKISYLHIAKICYRLYFIFLVEWFVVVMVKGGFTVLRMRKVIKYIARLDILQVVPQHLFIWGFNAVFKTV